MSVDLISNIENSAFLILLANNQYTVQGLKYSNRTRVNFTLSPMLSLKKNRKNWSRSKPFVKRDDRLRLNKEHVHCYWNILD